MILRQPAADWLFPCVCERHSIGSFLIKVVKEIHQSIDCAVWTKPLQSIVIAVSLIEVSGWVKNSVNPSYKISSQDTSSMGRESIGRLRRAVIRWACPQGKRMAPTDDSALKPYYSPYARPTRGLVVQIPEGLPSGPLEATASHPLIPLTSDLFWAKLDVPRIREFSKEWLRFSHLRVLQCETRSGLEDSRESTVLQHSRLFSLQ